MPKTRDEARLLHAMGFETANVHLATPKAIPDIRNDLKNRPNGWLHEAAKLMAKEVEKDWNDWRKGES
jgi:hypothetical protein